MRGKITQELYERTIETETPPECSMYLMRQTRRPSERRWSLLQRVYAGSPCRENVCEFDRASRETMSRFDRQYSLQAGRCFWCQLFTLPQNLTREHIYVRRNNQRRMHGSGYVLAHAACNSARAGLTIGSIRFCKWLRRVMRGDIRRFERRDKMIL